VLALEIIVEFKFKGKGSLKEEGVIKGGGGKGKGKEVKGQLNASF
jgi:hypothetical protein